MLLNKRSNACNRRTHVTNPPAHTPPVPRTAGQHDTRQRAHTEAQPPQPLSVRCMQQGGGQNRARAYSRLSGAQTAEWGQQSHEESVLRCTRVRPSSAVARISVIHTDPMPGLHRGRAQHAQKISTGARHSHTRGCMRHKSVTPLPLRCPPASPGVAPHPQLPCQCCSHSCCCRRHAHC